MSRRPTPETDELRDLYENHEYRATVGDVWELCESLERERDEARADVVWLRAAVSRLLNDSWNGPIDADHPARAMGAEALAKEDTK